MRVVRWVAGVALVLGAGLLCSALLLTFGRPPQPLPFGTVQWLGEAGVTVDGVERVSAIGRGPASIRAKGQFYIVHARIVAPYGLRPTWRDSGVEVRTFAYHGATQPPGTYRIDERAQRVLDAMDGRPGPVHEVRGASQREDLVFDLPVNVEQPGVVFLAANDPARILEWLFGRFWQPHRFNLRYD